MSEDRLLRAAAELCATLAPLRFQAPVTHVYNPLEYAHEMFAQYVRRFGNGPKKVIFLGMNPGPWGMAQTGIPFGEVAAVRDWLKLEAPVGKPPLEHDKRPVQGLDCRRSEVSGKRLWGAIARRFETPEAFFLDHYVVNYCPLLFLEASGKNRTPEQLPGSERMAIAAACDEHLRATVKILEAAWVVGVGNYAAERARTALSACNINIGVVPHPSPANPAANRGWEPAALEALNSLGIWL